MDIYNNDTGLTTPNQTACDSFIINVVFNPKDKLHVCECWLWADGLQPSSSVQPNQIRNLPVSAEGTQQEVESRVFESSPFDFSGEIVTLSNANPIGIYN